MSSQELAKDSDLLLIWGPLSFLFRRGGKEHPHLPYSPTTLLKEILSWTNLPLAAALTWRVEVGEGLRGSGRNWTLLSFLSMGPAPLFRICSVCSLLFSVGLLPKV